MKDKILSKLFPLPHHVEDRGQTCVLSKPLQIQLLSSGQTLHFSAKRLAEHLQHLGYPTEILSSPSFSTWAQKSDKRGEGITRITLQLSPALFGQAENYRLLVFPHEISILGADRAGVFYGVCTLIQMLNLADYQKENGDLYLPAVQISDQPDIRHRGVMLDVSRDKIPTMETLFDLVDRLASWKVNQLQLYMEHSFAYQGHEKVWKEYSPLTGDEILALDAYCHDRCVQLVPNQNSFGHMHRWLIHSPYDQLAECPEGIEHAFSLKKEPFSLCPTDPGTFELLEDIFDQLLPHFRSDTFNVGLDETFDLGKGRSKELCERVGTEKVYLDFLKKIHQMAAKRGKTIQFWGDIILKRPELIAELPRDVIAMVWGYEHNHPFAKQSQSFASAGFSFYVCPGTSTWNTVAGRHYNAIGNLSNAAINGHKAGAIGFLNTLWGDNGHMQPLFTSYLGFLAGAGFSWNTKSAQNPHGLDYPELLNRHAFQDPSNVMGKVVFELGNIYRKTGAMTFNSTSLFRLVRYADTTHPASLKGMSKQSLQETLTALEELQAQAETTSLTGKQAEDLKREFQWAVDFSKFACRLGLARFQTPKNAPPSALSTESKQAILQELQALMDAYKGVWLQKNRPGGFHHSVGRFEALYGWIEGKES